MKKTSEPLLITIICLIQFITPVMTSGTNIALPDIGRSYNATTFQLSLATLIYILGLVIALMPVGQLADIYGRRKMFIWGIVATLVTSCILPLAPNIETFLVIRFLQGAATAFITSTSLAILSSAVPQERRGKSMGLAIASVYAGLSAGPALGGFVVGYLGWKFLFWGIGAFTFAALILTLIELHGEWWGEQGQKFDLMGSFLIALSLGLLTIGVTSKEWIGEWNRLVCVLGVLVFVLFCFFEYHQKTPILNIHLLSENKALLFAALVALLNYAASFGVIFFFSLYLQNIRGLGAEYAGLFLMVQTAIECCLSPVSGKLSDSISPIKLATIGTGFFALSLFLASTIDVETSLYFVMIVLVIMGLGFGIFSSPNTIFLMNAVPQNLYGMVSSLRGFILNFGKLASMVIATYLIERYMGHTPIDQETQRTFIESMQNGMFVFAGIALLGLIVSMGLMTLKENRP